MLKGILEISLMVATLFAIYYFILIICALGDRCSNYYF